MNEQSLDKAKIQNLVKERNFLGYYITSAKTGQGLDHAFNKLSKEILR
ncbi:MAG: hypothetical protein ACTSPS_10550 [Promethearchaeota archaeon]